MLSFHAQRKVFVATVPCDLCTNFNGPWTAPQERLGESSRRGALSALGNQRRNWVKLLYFDSTGVCVLAKRLEKDTFNRSQGAGSVDTQLRLPPQTLQLLLDGADLGRHRSPNIKLHHGECRISRLSSETSCLCRIKIQT